MVAKTGIISGAGPVPRLIAAACRSSDIPYFILAIEDQTDPETVKDQPHGWIRMGNIGRGIQLLKDESVEQLVFAGPVRKPTLRELRPDAWTVRKIAQLGVKWLGDDSLLSALVKALEEEGFSVVGADQILTDCVAGAGAYGKHFPDEEQLSDLAYGLKIARAIGALDIGQAVVVQGGNVLGVEGIDGTDALIRRCGPLQRDGLGAVLVKACKPQQERRVDLPSIGLSTLSLAAEHNYAGVGIEAEKSLIFERAEMLALADAEGLFVFGLES